MAQQPWVWYGAIMLTDDRAEWVKWMAGAGLAVLLGGAAYLIAVRGEAIVIDLSSISRYAFCF
jgi:hypothetical protein